MIVAADAVQWDSLHDLPLLARFGPAQHEVIDYVTLVNTSIGIPQRPQSVVVPDDFLADVRSAIDDMPPVVKQLLDPILLGVYFARDLGSSAITDIVVSSEGQALGAVVALDFEAFQHRSANEWASWKENTPFSAVPGLRLEALIEEPAQDNRKNALQYLLLHEFGHVLTALRGFIPDWWIDPQTLQDSESYSYLPLAWRVDENKQIVPLPHNDFPLRGQVVYYHGAKLTAADMVDVYRQLQGTCFSTLYAAANVYEDFAETFATYVHAVLMNKRAGIRISQDGVLLLEAPAYWDSPRSARKREFLQSFLGN